jgi:hypothetical protein
VKQISPLTMLKHGPDAASSASHQRGEEASS